jgi:hypothetical protein
MPRESPIFFYLDAHWSEDLPLADETEFIIRNLNTFTIMIDDFEVPRDSGFAYNDYGPGKHLSSRDFHSTKTIESPPISLLGLPARNLASAAAESS